MLNTARQTVAAIDALRQGIVDGQETSSRVVRYELEIVQSQDHWQIVHFEMTEALNEPYEITLRIDTDTRDVDPSTYLGRDAIVRVRRGSQLRTLGGLVRRVVV